MTPWAAVRILKRRPRDAHGERGGPPDAFLPPCSWVSCCTSAARWGFLWRWWPCSAARRRSPSFYFQFVKVKMLPFDNKSEFQVIVDMPNGTTLEETARAANALARAIASSRKS